MRKNILLTGMPKSGKSTLLERIVTEQTNKVGILTREIREEGIRTGFEVVNYKGEHIPIASINFESNIQVSKYFVSIKNLDNILPSVLLFDKNNFLYLDEIGQMQMNSEKFKELTLKYLNSKNLCLATISKVYSNEFIDSIKQRHDIILVEITPENRDETYQFVTKLIGKIHKANRYSSESERFNISSNNVSIKTDHGEKHLVKNNNSWCCDCDFYSMHKICSHIIALEEVLSSKEGSEIRKI
jgi:nucleoside-triphosphatase